MTPLFIHDRSGAAALLPWTERNAAAADRRSLEDLDLLDAPTDAADNGTAGSSVVSRALTVGDARLVRENNGRPAVEAGIIGSEMAPVEEWRAEPVMDRDITNAASEPILTVSINPAEVVGPMITVKPVLTADAEVAQQLEPVVRTGVFALNIVLSAAVSLFERVSSVLHDILHVG